MPFGGTVVGISYLPLKYRWKLLWIESYTSLGNLEWGGGSGALLSKQSLWKEFNVRDLQAYGDGNWIISKMPRAFNHISYCPGKTYFMFSKALIFSTAIVSLAQNLHVLSFCANCILKNYFKTPILLYILIKDLA